MFKSVEDYLDALQDEMKDADPALAQDAQADAREHLSLALESAREKTPDVSEADALKSIVEEYGTPSETASAYREIERRTSPSLKQAKKPSSIWGAIFGVYIDPHTWGSLLFMFITFVTGILYFTWAVTGAMLSLSLMILIIGLPFALLFLFSVQGLALLEGRLVEALLGVRMPRRPLFAQPGLKWLERLKALVTDKHTWISMLYMVLQMPLGIVYFTLLVILISISLSFMVMPVIALIDRSAITYIYVGPWPLSTALYPLLMFFGFLVLTVSMHLIRTVGGWHGRYAKWMLVS